MVSLLSCAWLSHAAKARVRPGSSGVGFAVILTVFEGSHTNTFDKLRANQKRHDHPNRLGHDVPEPGRGVPRMSTRWDAKDHVD